MPLLFATANYIGQTWLGFGFPGLMMMNRGDERRHAKSSFGDHCARIAIVLQTAVKIE